MKPSETPVWALQDHVAPSRWRLRVEIEATPAAVLHWLEISGETVLEDAITAARRAAALSAIEAAFAEAPGVRDAQASAQYRDGGLAGVRVELAAGGALYADAPGDLAAWIAGGGRMGGLKFQLCFFPDRLTQNSHSGSNGPHAAASETPPNAEPLRWRRFQAIGHEIEFTAAPAPPAIGETRLERLENGVHAALVLALPAGAACASVQTDGVHVRARILPVDATAELRFIGRLPTPLAVWIEGCGDGDRGGEARFGLTAFERSMGVET